MVSHAGFCALGVKCQATDNPALRRYLGMRGDETGVLVTDVLKLGASAGVLRKDDVLLAVDGCAVANDGTVRFRGWERVAFDHVVSLKTPGEAATLTVRRRKQRIREEGASASAAETKEDPEGVGFRSSDSDSELLELVVHVHPRASLVPVHQYDRLPSFYVYAGLVFSPLTQPHLHEFGDDWFNVAPRALVDRALNHHPKRRGEQVVILSQVLADEINAGYQGMHDVEVRRVNGREVRNLAALAEAVEAGRGDAFLRVDFADDRVLVVGRREAEEAHERIMAKHRVPMRMSADLMNVRGGEGGGVARREARRSERERRSEPSCELRTNVLRSRASCRLPPRPPVVGHGASIMRLPIFSGSGRVTSSRARRGGARHSATMPDLPPMRSGGRRYSHVRTTSTASVDGCALARRRDLPEDH